MDVTNGFQKIIYLNCFTDDTNRVLSRAKKEVTSEFLLQKKQIYIMK